ncbi:MAG: nucleotidyl transferase AbiEii/AbiGii toxin family protein [Nocardioides sp.]
MEGAAFLTPQQIEVAGIFFDLKASSGYVVAGGAGLLASDLIARPTEDLDIFASSPTTSVIHAKEAFLQALGGCGFDATVVQASPAFCRIVVDRDGDEVLVDLAIDSPPNSTPTVTLLGPTLAPLELAGRKLLALFGRAEARDFADVYVLAYRFGTDELLEQARSIDAGFDSHVLAQMMATLGRLADDEIPLSAGDVPLAKAFFGAWAEELG